MIEVVTEKQHPALWQRIGGHWKMTGEYNELWWQYQRSQISRGSFFRKKADLKAAYDAKAGTSYIPLFEIATINSL
jgi:hypothetical protein